MAGEAAGGRAEEHHEAMEHLEPPLRPTPPFNLARGGVAVMLLGAWRALRSLVAHARAGPLRKLLRRVRLAQLPAPVRRELQLVRDSLLLRSRAVPPPFRKSLGEISRSFEDVPTFLLEVTVLSAGVAGGLDCAESVQKNTRRLAEAISLLFAAGRLHTFHRPGGSSLQLLGGDYLYAEGQWALAKLGALPVIRFASRTIKEFSDSSVQSVLAERPTDDIAERLRAAYQRTGAFFSMAASGSAWLSSASEEMVLELHRYARDLGCALDIVRTCGAYAQPGEVPLLDLALHMAVSARRAANQLKLQGFSSPAARGLRRLATAVEAEAVIASRAATARHGKVSVDTRQDAFHQLADFRHDCEDIVLELHHEHPEMQYVGPARSLGLSRAREADEELQALIGSGLQPRPGASVPKPEWPDGGPGEALRSSLKCIGAEQLNVIKELEGGELSASATSPLVRDEAALMLRKGGKRLRPALTLLIARALDASEEARRRVETVACAIEVLHSASLVHDDILDKADSRRGVQTLHTRRGELPAVFVGDFLFAVSSGQIADLGSVPVIQLIAKVIADFGRGELAQSALKYEVANYSLTDYLAKSFHKTASLLAAACQSAAVLSTDRSVSDPVAEACYRYGMYVGLAFQVVDDILDFTESDETLGKPAMADLKGGYVSAPVLLALQDSSLNEANREEFVTILDRKLSKNHDLERILGFIDQASGVEQSKRLARNYVELAVGELDQLPACEARDSLRTFAYYVISRSF